MYALRLDVLVNIGKVTAFEKRVDALFELIRGQKGLLAATLLNSQGQPQKYSYIYRFDTRESGLAAGRNPELESYLERNPLTGIATLMSPAEAAETVLFERTPGDVGELAFVDFTANIPAGGSADALISRCRELFALRNRLGRGVIVNGLSRYLGGMGGGGRYALAWGHRTAGDLQATFTVPEIQRFITTEKPLTNYATGPLSGETFDVVRSLVVQPVA